MTLFWSCTGWGGSEPFIAGLAVFHTAGGLFQLLASNYDAEPYLRKLSKKCRGSNAVCALCARRDEEVEVGKMQGELLYARELPESVP